MYVLLIFHHSYAHAQLFPYDHAQSHFGSNCGTNFTIAVCIEAPEGMPPKVRRHFLKASSHALAVEKLRGQRQEVQQTLRTMRADLKKDDML